MEPFGTPHAGDNQERQPAHERPQKTDVNGGERRIALQNVHDGPQRAPKKRRTDDTQCTKPGSPGSMLHGYILDWLVAVLV